MGKPLSIPAWCRILLLLAGMVALLAGVDAWSRRHYGRALATEQRRQLTLVVADSVERRAAARARRQLDSLRTLYETRLTAQARRYSLQRQRDQELERRYRATGPLVLPAY